MGMQVNTNFYYNLDADKQSQWIQFWQTCQHSHLRQHLLYGEIERGMGETPIYAIGEADGRIVCIGIFSIRPFFFSKKLSFKAECFWGPVFDDIEYAREFLLQVKSYFNKLSIGSIKIYPYWFYPQAEAVESMLNELGFANKSSAAQQGARFPTGLIDLNHSSDEIFASLKSKTRQEIRRTSRQGVSIRAADNWDKANKFYQYLRRMNRQRNLDSLSCKEFKATFEYILKSGELGVLLVAFYEQTFLGGLWIYRDMHICHYAKYVVIRQPLKKLSNLTVAPALWWHGIQWAKVKGCRWIDVEGYREGLKPYHQQYRLFRLKAWFNPISTQRMGTHTYIQNPIIYAFHKAKRFCTNKLDATKGMPYKLKTKWKSFKRKHFAGNNNG